MKSQTLRCVTMMGLIAVFVIPTATWLHVGDRRRHNLRACFCTDSLRGGAPP